jgi:hypothetical protein
MKQATRVAMFGAVRPTAYVICLRGASGTVCGDERQVFAPSSSSFWRGPRTASLGLSSPGLSYVSLSGSYVFGEREDERRLACCGASWRGGDPVAMIDAGGWLRVRGGGWRKGGWWLQTFPLSEREGYVRRGGRLGAHRSSDENVAAPCDFRRSEDLGRFGRSLEPAALRHMQSPNDGWLGTASPTLPEARFWEVRAIFGVRSAQAPAITQ